MHLMPLLTNLRARLFLDHSFNPYPAEKVDLRVKNILPEANGRPLCLKCRFLPCCESAAVLSHQALDQKHYLLYCRSRINSKLEMRTENSLRYRDLTGVMRGMEVSIVQPSRREKYPAD
jgi:hypothetical protein